MDIGSSRYVCMYLDHCPLPSCLSMKHLHGVQHLRTRIHIGLSWCGAVLMLIAYQCLLVLLLFLYFIYSEMQKALGKMTGVAEHINAMKKKYDAAVHVQEVQSLIRGWEVCTQMYCIGH